MKNKKETFDLTQRLIFGETFEESLVEETELLLVKLDNLHKELPVWGGDTKHAEQYGIEASRLKDRLQEYKERFKKEV